MSIEQTQSEQFANLLEKKLILSLTDEPVDPIEITAEEWADAKRKALDTGTTPEEVILQRYKL